MPAMNRESSWDFRDSQELVLGHEYNEEGFIITKADHRYLELIKHDIQQAYFEFISIRGENGINIENAHHVISHEQSNDLRLHIMQKITNTSYRNYYNAAKCIHSLCGNELAMQKRPDSQ